MLKASSAKASKHRHVCWDLTALIQLVDKKVATNLQHNLLASVASYQLLQGFPAK